MFKEVNIFSAGGYMQEMKHNHIWCTGAKYIKSGISWFIAGLILSFGVLIHYLVGSSWNTTEGFLSNVTLWFGSPLSLSVTYIILGGLGLLGLGGAYLAYAKCCEKPGEPVAPSCCTTSSCCPSHKCGALIWCNVGLFALLITGYIGYFIIDWIWGGFYYTPIASAKNLWLILQGLSILVYLIGFICASKCCCRCKKDSCCK